MTAIAILLSRREDFVLRSKTTTIDHAASLAAERLGNRPRNVVPFGALAGRLDRAAMIGDDAVADRTRHIGVSFDCAVK